MLYILLICYDASLPFEGPNLQVKHARLESELRERGAYVSGAGLMPVEVSGHLRVRNGQTLRTDGPFAETKEVLGGYYMVDCRDEAEAVQIAAQLPVEKRSWIEVRQIALFHPNVEVISASTGRV